MKNKFVLLVGASGGIGNKVAEMLLDEGFTLYGTYFQHPENVENLNSKKNFTSGYLDIRDTKIISDTLAKIRETTDFVFGVINCSGIVEFEGENLEKDFDIWKNTIQTNLSGNIYLAKIFFDILMENGRFIMISSTDSYFGGTITASYAASKAGVNSLTKSLSLMFQNKKVAVNSIAPGWVETPMNDVNGKEFMKKVAGINPLKRNAKPEDIANIISFLLSEKSSYLNGQVLSVEGGYTNQDPTLLLEEDVH